MNAPYLQNYEITIPFRRLSVKTNLRHYRHVNAVGASLENQRKSDVPAREWPEPVAGAPEFHAGRIRTLEGW
jgi:hypothetical protein